ncbi:hypothetical protein QAD02_005045 [Eretmocerus hayati]|uniref:Uncharacterized protein n=1 Tax=Eretmocerus hayati TaxID=131215 RepID=A0ACC2NSE6_9HYME|nr:hypothetical protein QAD02_005045 [Eretmocerus hayati]
MSTDKKIEYAKLTYCSKNDVDIIAPVGIVKVDNKKWTSTKTGPRLLNFAPKTEKDFNRIDVYRALWFHCASQDRNPYEGCEDEHCEHNRSWLKARIIALGETPEDVAENAEGVREITLPGKYKRSASELESSDTLYNKSNTEVKKDNVIETGKLSHLDMIAKQNEGKMISSSQQQPLKIKVEKNDDDDWASISQYRNQTNEQFEDIRREHPLSPKIRVLPPKSAENKRTRKYRSLRNQKCSATDSDPELNMDEKYEVSQSIVQSLKEKSKKVELTARQRARDRISQFEKFPSAFKVAKACGSPKKSGYSPVKLKRPSASPQSVKKKLFPRSSESGDKLPGRALPPPKQQRKSKKKSVKFDANDHDFFMAEKTFQIEQQIEDISSLQAKKISPIVLKKMFPSILDTPVRLITVEEQLRQLSRQLPAETNDIPTVPIPVQNTPSGRNRVIRGGQRPQRSNTSDSRNGTFSKEALLSSRNKRRRKASKYCRGKEKESYKWALIADVNYYYYMRDGGGYADWKKRYVEQDDSDYVYLGEEIYVHKEEWNMMKEQKDPRQALKIINLIVWEEDDFANLTIEPENVKPKNCIPGKLVQQMQHEKLRHALSLYKDAIYTLQPKQKRMSMEEMTKWLEDAPRAISRHAKSLRDQVILELQNDILDDHDNDEDDLNGSGHEAEDQS